MIKAPRGFIPYRFQAPLHNCEKRILVPSCLSVGLKQLRSHWKDFHEVLVFENFSKICYESWSFSNIWQEWRALYMTTYVHLWRYLEELFLKWEMFQTEDVEWIKTHIFCSINVFWKSCCLWECRKIWYSQPRHRWLFNSAPKRHFFLAQ
jgi:hypothetical protein